MSDEELDALFRRGAAAYPDDRHPGAWARMEDKLNAATQTRLLRRKVGRLLAGEAAFICLIIWQASRFMVPTPPAGPQPHPAAQVTAASQLASPKAARSISTTTPLKPGQPTASAVAASAGVAPQPVALAAARAAKAARPINLAADATPTPLAAAKVAGMPGELPGKGRHTSLTNSILLSNLAVATNRRPTHQLRPEKANKQAGVVKTEPATETAIYVGALTPLATGNEPGAGGAARAALPANASEAAGPAAPTPPASHQAALAADGPAELAALLPAALPVPGYPLLLPDSLAQRHGLPADSTRAPRPAPHLPYRLVVGLLGAPSWSAVRTPQTARLGGDYGLTLEYRLTARLRVRAGLLSSRKRYGAATSDYVAPAAWQWHAGDYELDADCRVTEIPLDLRYDVVSRPSVVVFTSLGLNSLLMRDERYSYDWTMNGQMFTKTAQVLRGSNYFLSVLNVSVGVERPLSARWAAQVEPYWQFPLGGVGAGQVRLSSAGAYFSLKYSLLR